MKKALIVFTACLIASCKPQNTSRLADDSGDPPGAAYTILFDATESKRLFRKIRGSANQRRTIQLGNLKIECAASPDVSPACSVTFHHTADDMGSVLGPLDSRTGKQFIKHRISGANARTFFSALDYDKAPELDLVGYMLDQPEDRRNHPKDSELSGFLGYRVVYSDDLELQKFLKQFEQGKISADDPELQRFLKQFEQGKISADDPELQKFLKQFEQGKISADDPELQRFFDYLEKKEGIEAVEPGASQNVRRQLGPRTFASDDLRFYCALDSREEFGYKCVVFINVADH